MVRGCVLVNIGSLIIGGIRALTGLLNLQGGRPRLTVEGDWGVSLKGNLRITVRNPGPQAATIEDLYLKVRSPIMGTQTVRLTNLSYEGKVTRAFPGESPAVNLPTSTSCWAS